MENGFYLADVTHKKIDGSVVTHKDQLHFKLARAHFDGVATKEHVKSFVSMFQAFKLTHPDFVLPDKFSEVEIGSPVTSAPVVVEKHVAVSKDELL